MSDNDSKIAGNEIYATLLRALYILYVVLIYFAQVIGGFSNLIGF
jgi:hypothetical protein